MVDMPLWTGRDILEAVQGQCDAEDWIANGVAIDSRAVTSDDLFIAIVGPNNDGHDYVVQAFKQGASAAIVSHIPKDVTETSKLILVGDTQIAMEELGRASRARSTAKIVAVTGSVGKTGTKEALAHILSVQGKTHYSVGSFNNHWGVPLSLARMPADAEFAIFELGMNHAGELGPLSRMVRPHIAIITTVAAAHLEFFENTEAIARAKAEIFDGVEAGGLVLLNADNEFCDLLVSLATDCGVSRIALFGEKRNANIHLDNVELKPNFSEISASILGEKQSFILSVPGRHWVQNTLSILGAIKELGIDLGTACKRFSTLQAPSGRGVLIEMARDGRKFTVIDESYNASPVAMQAAFKVLGQMKPAKSGRKIAVLGDMRELGKNSLEIHANLAKDITASGIDMVYAAGPNMRSLSDALPEAQKAGYGTSSDELVQPIIAAIREGDIVLIKGSLGSKMKVILDALSAAYGDVPTGNQVEV